MFQLFHSYVAANSFMLQVTSVIFFMFHVFHTHVASACYKCFISFETYVPFKKNFMLQVFYVVRSGRRRMVHVVHQGGGAPADGALGQADACFGQGHAKPPLSSATIWDIFIMVEVDSFLEKSFE
jgi:hypothetical protein